MLLSSFTTLFPFEGGGLAAVAADFGGCFAGEEDLESDEEDLEKNPIACPQGNSGQPIL